MATSRINLNTSSYVQINIGRGQIIIEALAGDIHIALSATQPIPTNSTYHKLTDRQRLTFDALDTNVWAIGRNSTSQAVVTEFPSSLNSASGVGDMTTDAWGVQKISRPLSLFHSLFTYDVNQNLWLYYHNNVEVFSSTNITSEDGQLKLLTDATNTDVHIESRECPRYQPNRGHLFSTAVRCPNKFALCDREWGLGFDGENEVAFELKPDGKLYAEITSGGVKTYEEEIDTSSIPNFDVEKNNIYDIQYQWRSAGNYKFFIGDPDTGHLKLVHTIDYLGKLDRLSIENPALPVHLSNTSQGGHAPMYVGCVDMTSENGQPDRLVYGSAYAEDVAVSGTNEPVIVLKQPLTIGAYANTQAMILARITVTCDKKAAFKVWMTRDATAITGATFRSVNAGTYVETDSTDMDATAVRATSVDITKMNLVTAIPVLAGTAREVDNPVPLRIIFPVVRGDYLVITCDSTTSVADCMVEYGLMY